MAIGSSSVVTAGVPKRFCGLRVLLIDSDETSLKHHAHILSQFSYKVTSALSTTSGMSMILEGNIFECALIDADTCEMDLVEFVDQILKHHPEISIIMMASKDVHMLLAKYHHGNEAILWLHKPCALSDMCNIWQHICRKRTAFEEDHSNGMFPEENQALHINDRVNNNVSYMVTDHQQHINETSVQKSIGTATGQQADKGKQPLEIQSEKDQPNEEVKKRKKRKAIEKRFTWTPELHAKFLEAVKELGEQKAIPSKILKLMNEPGLTRSNVMSHLQNFRRGNANKVSNIDPPVQRDNNFIVESCARKRSRQSTPSNDDAAIIDSSKRLKPENNNIYGISYMTIDSIKARLQAAPPLPAPLVTTPSNDDASVINSSKSLNPGNLNFFGRSYMTIDDIKARLHAAPPLPAPLVTTPSNDDASVIDSSKPHKPENLNFYGKSYMTIDDIKARLQAAPPLDAPPVPTPSNDDASVINSSKSLNPGNLKFYSRSYMTIDDIKARLHAASPLPAPLVTTPSNDDASVIDSSKPHKPENLNFYGKSYMTIDDIKARLQAAPPLPAPLVTTSMNNINGVKGTDHNLSEPQQPLTGETCMSTTFGLVENEKSHSGGQYNEAELTSYGCGNVTEQLVTGDHSSHHANNFSNGNSVGAACGDVRETVEPLDCFGIATEPSLAAGGGTAFYSNNSYGKAIEQVVTGDNSSNHTVENLNFYGISSMTIDNIKARLQAAPPLLAPVVTTSMNNIDGVKETDNNLSEPQQPLIGETCMSIPFGLFENSLSGGQYNEAQLTSYGNGNVTDHSSDHANSFSNGFYDGNSVGVVCGGVNETEEPLDCFGIAMEPLVVGGGVTAFSSDHGYGKAIEQVVTGDNSDHGYGKAIEPLEEAMTLSSVIIAVPPDYNMGMHNNDFSNSFEIANFEGDGGNGVSEALAPFDGFGIPLEPWVAAVWGDTHAASDYGPEDVAFPEFLSYDLENLCQSDNFLTNRENLVPNLPPSTNISDNDIFLNPINSDLVSNPGEEYNSQDQILTAGSSNIPLDGSEGRVVDDDSFKILSPDFQMIMQILDEVDADLINGPW